MIYIAHRGLFTGSDRLNENNPKQIEKALMQGYECEIDVRLHNNKFFLGHDDMQYEVDEHYLKDPRFWIHCKNIDALYYFSTCKTYQYNYFWHENDQYTMTSKGFIWTFPGKDLTDNSVMVMPEYVDSDLTNTQNVTCYAICSDYVEKIKRICQ